jgi:hypothetical protein
MAERDPSRIDEDKGPTSMQEPQGAKAAAQDGGGNPETPSVGQSAESHHIAHAGSKAGEREDDENVEDSRTERKTDPSQINPVADEANPPGAPDQRRNVA